MPRKQLLGLRSRKTISNCSSTSEVGSHPRVESVDNNQSECENRDETLIRLQRIEQQLSTTSVPVISSLVPVASYYGNLKLPAFDPTSKFADAEGWCAIVDLWVQKQNPDTMQLVMTLSAALKGEAASWLISAKPTEREWPALRAEFLAVFAKPVDPLEQFSEAVGGKRNVQENTPLIDERLHSMRTILALLKNRESDESFAVLVACYFGSPRNGLVRRRYQVEQPRDAKSMCTMLQGRIDKRPALFPSGHHTGSKRLVLSPSAKNENPKILSLPPIVEFITVRQLKLLGEVATKDQKMSPVSSVVIHW